ncbi:hypothetical protein EDD21DRAFT_390866 [Dissophora ornata]|nr:hypothetical protein EDD21DRAFT_390866 [Dissophora ornata]
MAEEYQSQLDYDENDESYYDKEEEEEVGDNEQEDEYEDEDGDDIQIGEEIELTHKEVWDDTALIEAWDAAVKQYEVYHSKTKAQDQQAPPISSTSTPTPTLAKSKNKAEQLVATTSSPSKRSKPNGDTTDGGGAIKGSNDVSENGETSKVEQEVLPSHVPTQSKPNSAETEYAVTERKPSFRKADKPSFSHRKEDRKTNGGVRGEGASTTTTPTKAATSKTSVHRNQKVKAAAATTPSTMSAPVDAATIAYYQQLGYYYDPSYDNSSQRAETGEGNEEEQKERGEDGREQQQQGDGATRSNIRAPVFSSSNATLSKSSAFAKNRAQPSSSSSPLASASPSSAATAPFGFGSGFGSGSMPMFSPHQYQHGFYPGYPAHIPAAGGATGAHGGFGVPGAPGMPSMWRGGHGVGAVPMPMPMPYGPGPGPGPGPIPAGGRHYPMGMMPPPPLAGQVSAAGMDDEALSNLIMAWYFSGYYTGLYQAQRR